jgi:hypothetical protein
MSYVFVSVNELRNMRPPHFSPSPTLRPARSKKLSWAMLCDCESQLKELERDIRGARGEPGRLWYNTFKPQLVRLVGWESGAPDGHPIGTMDAYGLCVDHLVKILFAVRPKRRKRRFSLRPENAV